MSNKFVNPITMLDDKVYDLMMQIIQESKSLHRIKKYYCVDAKGDEQCDDVWARLMKNKEEHINQLVKLLREYL